MADMAADDSPSDEERRLVGWHRERLILLGWPEREADNLSHRVDVDLHLVEQLIVCGCDRVTAWRIAS